ncbi:MAG: S8 family peptidase [Lachnospiraceae bacterium]
MTCQEKILSDQYVDVLTDFQLNDAIQVPKDLDYCYQNIDSSLGIFYIKRKQLPEIDTSTYGYLYIPKCYGLMSDSPGTSREKYDFNPLSLINSGILAVQRPPLSLTGRGVAIGFIDTGIRYQEEVFRNADGSSRILGLWDQTIQSGTPPKGLQYGSAYSREEINMALQAEDPYSVLPSTDTIGHGTAIASVAAGSNLQQGFTFTGAAPDADILVVKLKEAKPHLRNYYNIPEGVPCYAGSDIWSALYYLESFAQTFIRPIVICIGIGTNLGDHAGNAEVSRYLHVLSARRNRAIVICGGNEGNAGHHYEGNINGDSSSPWEDVELRVAEGEQGFLTELWGATPHLFTIAIRSPSGELIPRIYYKEKQSNNYSFVYEKTILTVGFALIENSSGDELITIRFINPTPGIWTIRVFSEGNRGAANFHMWLPIRGFLQSDTHFLKPNPYTTLTVPGFTENAITVSTYDDKNNSFYLNSGRGFSRTNRIKPDISAPGVNVSTVLGTRSGAGMAAAITAGGVAQFLQWAVTEGNDPLVDSINIKNYLIRGASRSEDLTYPNRDWGYGRLNIAGVFDWLAGFS